LSARQFASPGSKIYWQIHPKTARRKPRNTMHRFHQILLIGSTLAVAWLWMQAVHELGHCLGAWATGGTVKRVVLHPLAISRTDVTPNPWPLIVAWCGPVIGIFLPAFAWGATAAFQSRFTWLPRFFAGFCLLANGIYLGVGSFQGIGDAGDIVRLGSPVLTLWLFGLAAVPAGFAAWNGLGPHFGLGEKPLPIDRHVAYGCVALLIATIFVECLLSSRI
jgi:hypothetical protein